MKDKDRTGGYVTIIGGVNVDIQGFPKDKLIPEDSNIGTVKISMGGVGRNIGENLVRLGIKTRLISVVGDDYYSQKILRDSSQIGLDMNDTLVVKGQGDPIYLAVLAEDHDMYIGINSMGILENMTIDFIKDKKVIIDNSGLLVLDTNIPEDILEFLLQEFRNKSIFLDTVSVSKAKKARNLIGNVHTLKTNRLEVEAITGIGAGDEEGLVKNSSYLLNKGVKAVFITLGKDGVFFSNNEVTKIIRAENIKPVNATGAGDAFMAAMIYCYIMNAHIDEAARFATAASLIALSHEDTINPNMSKELIDLKMKELDYHERILEY